MYCLGIFREKQDWVIWIELIGEIIDMVFTANSSQSE